MVTRRIIMPGLLAAMLVAVTTEAGAGLDWWMPYDGLSSNTIALYPFESSGMYTNGANVYSTVLPDQSGSDWDAYYSSNSATCYFGSGGWSGNGLHVPGGTGIASKCSTYFGADIFPDGADPSLSVECWVLFNDDTARQFLISKGNAWSSKGGYDLWYDHGVLKCAFGDSNTNTMMTTIAWTPSTGEWYHVAATWNAATDTAKLFVDGEELVSKAFSGSSIVDHSARTLAIGQRTVSTYSALDGIIDEVRISSVAYAFEQTVKPKYATYPWGDKFWFSFYSTIGGDSAYAVENGATGIGPYYGGLSGQVSPLAEANDLGAAFSYKVQLPSMADFSAHATNFVWPSDATLVAETKAVVSAVRNNPNISMWDLVPEELRHWKPNELHYLEVVADAIRAADPQGRPVMMYEPNNRKTSNLINTIPFLDICSKGTYVTAVNDGAFRHNRIWARWSMEQQLDAIATAHTNAVPWIMLHMAYDVPEGEEHLIKDWCRHDAYMGLIMGGKGISIWSGWRPRPSWTNDFDAFLDGYLSVAEDLNQTRNLAPVFLYGTEVAGVSRSVTSGPPTLELIYGGETNNDPSVTYRMLQFLGQQYLFALNSATQSVTLTFSGVPDAARTDLFSETTVPASGGSFDITLDPYEVAGYRFDGYDAWRAQHFPGGGDDGENADPDLDGHTNRDEFYAGTDPNDGNDYFRAELSFTKGWQNLSFNTSSQRFYNVDRSTNLVAGHWFEVLGNELGSGTDMTVLDTNTFPRTFYRIRAMRP